MDDYISRQAAIEAICKVCSIVGDYHKCDGYPETSTWCDELVALRALPSADELTIVTEYCRKRNLVIITMESFRVLQAYYNRQNGKDSE